MPTCRTTNLWHALDKANREKIPFVIFDEAERNFLVSKENYWELPELDFAKDWTRIGTVCFFENEDLKTAIDAILDAHDSYGIALNTDTHGIGIFVRCPLIAPAPLSEEEFMEGVDGVGI